MHQTFTTRTAHLIALVLIAASASAAEDPAIEPLSAALEKARSEQVDALAPTGFAAASEALANARRDAERGRNPERVRTRVSEGLTALEAANKAAAGARTSLGNVVKTREETLVAEAPKFAAEAWGKAATRFND